MSASRATQLRLLRDAGIGLAASAAPEAAATFGAMTNLLAELIAEEEAGPIPTDDPAREREAWAALDAAVLVEKASAEADGEADALPHPALRDFLAHAVPGEEAIEIVASRTVARGNSKKTMLVDLAGMRRLPARIALRIDRTGNYVDTKVSEEFPILELLWRHGARIPEPFAVEPDGIVIGEPFLVVAAAPGAPVGGNYIAPPPNKALVADVAVCLAGIHACPLDAWPRPDLPLGPAHIDAEIERTRADWRATGGASAIVDAAFAWILANRDRAYGPPALVHNDFNFNNLLVDGDRVTAVLDWEFAHVGTAAADLGFFFYSAERVSSFAAFLAAYAAAGGTVPPTAQLDFYILWGQLRLAVMGFQAVQSLEQGRSPDIRFGIARWHRRQGLLRLGALLPGLASEGIVQP